MSEVDLRRLRQQPPLRLELDAADEQVPAVAHVAAYRALNAGHDPQADDDGQQVLELKRAARGLRRCG